MDMAYVHRPTGGDLGSRNHGSASDMLTTQTYMNMAVTSIMWRYK